MTRTALLAAAVFLVACEPPEPKDPMHAATIAVLCQNRVKEQLRSPSTAKFPNLMPLVKYEPGRRVATVESYVDAQNAFGATVRSNFDCRVERKADGSGWTVTAVVRAR